MTVLSGSQIGLVDELSVDAQFERKVKVQQIVQKGDLELLITIGCSPFDQQIFGRNDIPTFPASLATKALITDGASCFASKVSSSFSSHLIAKLNCGKWRGMVQV
jgi:hypothetical protein